MTSKYVVPIIYRGMTNVLVEADSLEDAIVKAKSVWIDGDDSTVALLGNEWEEIESYGEAEVCDVDSIEEG